MAAPAPQATTAGSYTPILTDLLRLVRAPFAPTGVFEEQREKPTFWMPWIVLSVIFMVLGLINQPITKQMIKVQSEAAGRPVSPSAETIGVVFSVLGGPIGLLIGVLITAVILYFILMVTGAEARFKGLMTVGIFIAPITVLQQCLNTVVLRMRGIETIQSAKDLQVSFGLDLLLPSDSETPRILAAILRGVGPFELWALVITALALMALEKVPKSKAWTASVVAFVIGLLIRAGSAMIFKM
jgi:hypothetical protein